MPQWLQIYLAFTLAGGLVTYFTVIRQIVSDVEDIEDIENLWTHSPVIGFLVWMAGSILTGPFLFYIVITGNIGQLRKNITERWLDDAGYDD